MGLLSAFDAWDKWCNSSSSWLNDVSNILAPLVVLISPSPQPSYLFKAKQVDAFSCLITVPAQSTEGHGKLSSPTLGIRDVVKLASLGQTRPDSICQHAARHASRAGQEAWKIIRLFSSVKLIDIASLNLFWLICPRVAGGGEEGASFPVGDCMSPR